MLKYTNKNGISSRSQLLVIILLAITISACGGSKTFNDYARAGDTVAVAGGWKQNFNLDNISVTIETVIGGTVLYTYLQGDPAIRASVNFYADPLSSMIVSRETGIEQTAFANTYSAAIDNNYTSGDKDWWQTTVFVDLPTTLTAGTTYKVKVTNTQGDSFKSNVQIIDGLGTPSLFSAEGQDLQPEHIAAISRVPHNVVSFQGTTIPYAIELTLSHSPDSTVGGTGKAHVVNPIGYKKNLTWTDDGTQMKVILTPASNINAPDNIQDYKFYVAGGINNLIVDINSVLAYDQNGNSVPGVTASTTASN